MRFLWLALLMLATRVSCFGAAGEPFTLHANGSLSGPFAFTDATDRSLTLRFGFPAGDALSMWRDGSALRGLWVSNAVEYRQTVLLTDLKQINALTNSTAHLVLLVNIEGYNTNSEYAEAAIGFSVEAQGKSQCLKMNGDELTLSRDGQKHFLALLEVPESGVKVDTGERLQFYGNMPPMIKGSMTLKVPLWAPLEKQQVEALRDLEFDAVVRTGAKGPAADEWKRRLRMSKEDVAELPAR
jgi:hypothetical protein